MKTTLSDKTVETLNRIEFFTTAVLTEKFTTFEEFIAIDNKIEYFDEKEFKTIREMYLHEDNEDAIREVIEFLAQDNIVLDSICEEDLVDLEEAFDEEEIKLFLRFRYQSEYQMIYFFDCFVDLVMICVKK
jgi:hypothetical protein